MDQWPILSPAHWKPPAPVLPSYRLCRHRWLSGPQGAHGERACLWTHVWPASFQVTLWVLSSRRVPGTFLEQTPSRACGRLSWASGRLTWVPASVRRWLVERLLSCGSPASLGTLSCRLQRPQFRGSERPGNSEERIGGALPRGLLVGIPEGQVHACCHHAWLSRPVCTLHSGSLR